MTAERLWCGKNGSGPYSVGGGQRAGDVGRRSRSSHLYSNRIHKHGSGVGLVNVNNRIKILFGKEYGLLVESEPDEGTRVSIPYTGSSLYGGKQKNFGKRRFSAETR